jgi:hypothetical protein
MNGKKIEMLLQVRPFRGYARHGRQMLPQPLADDEPRREHGVEAVVADRCFFDSSLGLRFAGRVGYADICASNSALVLGYRSDPEGNTKYLTRYMAGRRESDNAMCACVLRPRAKDPFGQGAPKLL